jgi:hypothetical protein
MKTPATLIATVALLVLTEAALIKPAPGTTGDLTGAAPNTRKVLPNLGKYIFLYIHHDHRAPSWEILKT